MFGASANVPEDARPGAGEKLFLTVFGLIFAGIGSLMLWLFVRDAISGLQTWTWRKTNCAIVASNVSQHEGDGRQSGDFFFDVKYSYIFDGSAYSSEQYKRSPESSDNYSKSARLVEKYPAGSSAICYVNPAAPGRAVLARYNLFGLLLNLFPLPFVAIGGAILYGAWRPARPASSISSRAAPARKQWITVLFMLVFLGGGSAAFCGFFLRPAFEIMSARSWPAVPCMVISSEVRSYSGKGTTYSVNIFYSYEVKGRAFKSNTYGFMGGSSTGYAGKQAVVARNPPGTRTVCYVNPAEPTEAVLERGFTPDMWFGLIPLLFMAVGGAVLFSAVRQRRRNALAAGAAARAGVFSGSAHAVPAAYSSGGLPDRLVLKPAESPWVMFVGAIFLCLFWNGIVSVFVLEAVSRWRSGHPEWGLMLFLIPFVAIGSIFIGAVVYCFMALFNPRPHLTVTPGAVPLGGTLQVQWHLTGRAGILQNLRLRLEGREEATDNSGRYAKSANSVFADLEIASITTPREMQSGEARLTVPAGLVPSFAAPNNKILWSIRVHGRIAYWPDLKEEFPVTVLPSAPAARHTL